jgi:NADH-quinone oxidoreductase subunit M
LLPEAASAFAPVAAAIGLAGVIYGAVLAFAQTDFKRFVAYTSVSHMGYVLLGIFAGNALALQGAVLEMVCHGLATGALFVLVGQIQERTGTRAFARLGGLWATVPRMGGFALVFALASLGIPGLGNFIAEFLILFGAYQVSPWWAALGAIGLVFSMVYALQIMQRVFYGPNRHGWRLPDLNARETAALASMALLLLALGLWPQPVFDAARGGLAAAEQALGAGAHTVSDDLAGPAVTPEAP